MTTSRSDTDARLRLGAVRLPALPEILLKLMALYRRDDVGMAEFAALIDQDAAMAAKVMAVANSAAYRSRGPVNGLERALSLLGVEMVRTLVISQSIFQAFNSLPAIRRLDLLPFWQHGLMAGAVARLTARHMAYPREDEAQLAGMLHDIGRLALLAAVPELYADDFAGPDDRIRCEAERQRLQVSHAEAGAWLVERWRLDDYLADSLRYHHEPLPRLAATHPLIRIVALAHRMAEPVIDAAACAEAGALCGLRPAQLEALATEARTQLSRAMEQLGLSAPGAATTLDPGDAAERLRDELAPMMVAATVLADLPVTSAEAEALQRLADAARIVFQFREVVVMLPEQGLDADGELLRWIGAGQAAPLSAMSPQWAEFSLPCAAGTRLGDAIQSGRAAFIQRGDAAPALSVVEDQLLRLIEADHVVCLPVSLPAHGMATRGGARSVGALVCAADAALVAGLRERLGFVSAFMVQAEAGLARASRQMAAQARERADEAQQRHQLAQDLVHEVNNPLSIIQNYLSLLDMKLSGGGSPLGGPGAGVGASIGQDLAVLQEEVARVSRLVQALGHPPVLSVPGSVDANALIVEVVRLFRSSTSGIDILAHGHDDAQQVRAPRDDLKQVLVNLLKNAVEALCGVDGVDGAGQPGVPAPGSRIVVANNGLVNRDGRLMVELSVRDNGSGMSAERLQRLFGPVAARTTGADEPPPSTKPVADRGRGLAIVQRLVAGMDGLLQCRSSVIGTSVDLFIPQGVAPVSAGVTARVTEGVRAGLSAAPSAAPFTPAAGAAP